VTPTRPVVTMPAGFTLLEVVAALAVLGLLLLVLTQGMQFGLRAWQTVGHEVMRPAELEAVDRTLRRLVTRVVAKDTVEGRGAVVGAPTALDVVTRLPPDPDGPKLASPVEARLEVDAAHRLVLSFLPRPHAQWLEPPRRREVVLLEHVQRVEFGFWREARGGGGTWSASWNIPSAPTLIRIRIIFPHGDARHWPDIVAAPALGPVSEESSRYLCCSGCCALVQEVKIG